MSIASGAGGLSEQERRYNAIREEAKRMFGDPNPKKIRAVTPPPAPAKAPEIVVESEILIESKEKQPVSILITAYKSQNFIEECLDSIENQTYFKDNNNYEILLGIDACEETLQKIKSIGGKYRNLRVFMMKSNKGPYVTLNTLLDLVNYENIIIFGSDDVMKPIMIEIIMSYSNNYNVIRFQFDDFTQNINFITNSSYMRAFGAIFYKKYVIDGAGGYKDWRCSADFELLRRLSGRIKLKELADSLFYRRDHPESLSNKEGTSLGSQERKKYNKQVRSYNLDEDIKIDKVINEYKQVNIKNIIHSINEITKIHGDFFSIVIPTMWKSEKLFDMLPEYEKSEYVKEIIIIDNDPKETPDLTKYSKVRYYTKGKNIYVNPAWNWGYSLSNYKLILANDDIFIHNVDTTFRLIIDSDYDIVGVDVKKSNVEPCIQPINEFPANSYGCFMFIKKYVYIPEQFKIWYGDYFLFNGNTKRGILRNIGIIAEKSKTINSNIKEFREKLGKLDVKEYDYFEKSNDDNFNIIIRTSGRPVFFYKCVESIRKNCINKNIKLHITIDNINDLEYVKKYAADFNYSYYLIDKESILNICRNIEIERQPFIYNYYINVVIPFLNGWCLFLDDDDELLINPEFQKNDNHIYLFRTDIGVKIVPNDINFGKRPVLNDISGLGIIFHSSQIINWKPQRGGDFEFISTLYNNFSPVWIDKVISKTQTGGNKGKRNDIKNMPISVNMATYPARKEVLIKCINNLLDIYLIDKIRIYLNEYENIPDDLPRNDKILYFLGNDNLKDSGKFYWAIDNKPEYYFTIDDDLIYPESYFIEHLLLLNKYNNEIFVSLHGKQMKKRPSCFNDASKSFHCLKHVSENEWINNPGTGVMVFDNSKFAISINMFKYHGMCDLWISYYCQKYGIPIICRKHTCYELGYLLDKNADTLFEQRDQLKVEHNYIINLIGNWNLYTK